MTINLRPSSRPTLKTNLHYGPLSQQRLDIYMPSNAFGSPRPVVVILHGGSFNSGDKAGYQPDFTPMLTKAGFIVADMDYRLAGGPTPDMLNDTQLAVRWLRANANQLYISPDRICLNGWSAGATLAVAAGALTTIFPGDMAHQLANVSPKVQCAVSNSGPVTMTFQGTHDSPLSMISSRSAPMLVTNGTRDPIVSIQQAYQLVSTLNRDHVPSSSIYYPAGHVLSGLSDSAKNAIRSREIVYMQSKLAP